MIIFDGKCKLVSVNQRYNKNFSLTKEYRAFKEFLHVSFKDYAIEAGELFGVTINLVTHLDIDAPIKAILDAIQFRYNINDKDCNALVVTKAHCKRNEPNHLTVTIRGYYDIDLKPKKCRKHKRPSKTSGRNSHKRRSM